MHTTKAQARGPTDEHIEPAVDGANRGRGAVGGLCQTEDVRRPDFRIEAIRQTKPWRWVPQESLPDRRPFTRIGR